MKKFLVTGCSSGVGLQVVMALRALGHRVYGISRDEARAEAAGFNIGTWRAFDFGVDKTEHVETWLQHVVRQFDDDPLAGIFHAAGHEVFAPARMLTDEAMRRGLSAALGAALCIRIASHPAQFADGGSLVMMSSVAAHRGSPGLGAYAAGKAAVEALVRTAAVELAPRGIRVNAVAAGAFGSPLHARIIRRQSIEGVAKYRDMHPLGFGDVSQVGRTVLDLLLHDDWSTGSVRVIDGGFLAK